jgi:hypothetical protein
MFRSKSLSSAFTRPFLYLDTNGKEIYDDTYVTLSPEPDAESFYTAVVDISVLTEGNEPARVIFALNSPDNGTTSV